jgi:hypothetical protein
MTGADRRPVRTWIAQAVAGSGVGGTPRARAASRPAPDELPEGIRTSEPEALPAAAVDPDERPPDGFAVLRVHRKRDRYGQEAFGVSGECGELRLPFVMSRAPLRPPELSLAILHELRRDRGSGQEDRRPWPSQLLRGIRDWSGGQEELRRWLDEVRARHGSALRLVIWDDTDYEIPWELLWLEADAGRSLTAGHLGALVTVARWTTLRGGDDSRPMVAGTECAGPVHGYYDQHMRRDADVFAAYAHRRHDALLSLITELAERELRAGLVYLACHGRYGDRLYDLWLDQVTWDEMNEADMAALRAHTTLVCLNACHSARPVRNLGRGEDALRGFAELFLRQGASGCIASSGQVGDEIAHEAIRLIVAEIAADPAKPVAQSLREFRARAMTRLPEPIPHIHAVGGDHDVPGQRDVLAFLYSFMFVYYGSPMTTLRLTPRGHEEAS